ncbi:MAG: PEP-CTERM sorting domain-containing protein [Planctomycetes bacterium]|nr:PEP-CTERM sorting domain-containing protein [Planctomycetota bacterium]
MREKMITAVGVIAVVAMTAAADDLWPPPWDPTLPNQTYQAWEAPQEPDGTYFPPGTIFEPTCIENPYGPATIMFLPPENQPPDPAYGTTIQWVEDYHQDPPGMEIATWHVDGPEQNAPAADLVITIKNNPDDNLKKLVFWQITADKSITPQGDPPITNPPGTALPSPNPQIWWTGSWYTYNGLLEIQPNPEEETIIFPGLLESTNISEIVIKTICIPEPATMAMLAAGGLLGLLRRRRRG